MLGGNDENGWIGRRGQLIRGYDQERDLFCIILVVVSLQLDSWMRE